MPRIGFIGTGSLTEAVVHGLYAAHGEDLEITVTNRSEARAEALAAAHPALARAGTAAEVAERSTIVVLAIRPPQLEAALTGVRFRPDQTVVSFLAGTPLAVVRAAVAPAGRVVRINPLPPIRLRRGPLVMVPPDAEVEALFRPLGDLIVSADEAVITAIANASAAMSSHFQLQNTLVAWLESRGMPAQDAALYVRSFFAGLGEIGLRSLQDGTPVDPLDYETPGGLNERVRRHLNETGWFDRLTEGLGLAEAHTLRARDPAAD